MREWSTLRKLMLTKGATGVPLTEHTATGNPLTFQTNKSKPLVSLTVPFTPVQSGTGDPSPTNVRPITGFTGVNVWQYPNNELEITSNGVTSGGVVYTIIKDGDNVKRSINVKGKRTTSNSFCSINYVNATTLSIPVGTYKVYGYTSKVAMRVYIINAQGSEQKIYDSTGTDATFTIPSDAKSSWLRLQANTDDEIDETIYPILLNADDTLNAVSVTFPVLGKNLFDASKGINGYINSSGELVKNQRYDFLSDYICLEPNKAYIISVSETIDNIGICLFNETKTSVLSRNNNTHKSSVSIPSASEVRYLRFWINNGTSADMTAEVAEQLQTQCEEGSSKTTYEPYTSTAYGGSLNLTTGVLTVTWKAKKVSEIINGYQENWGGRFRGENSEMASTLNTFEATAICEAFKSSTNTNSDMIILSYGASATSTVLYIKDSDYNTVEAFNEACGNYMVAYPLRTSITYQLTPAQIQTLIGDNTIWSDTNGSNTAVYLKKG